MSIKEKLIHEIQHLEPELIELTTGMIRIPSINPTIDTVNRDEAIGGETKVNKFLLPYLNDIGMETDLWEEEPGRANLVGVRKGIGQGRSLIFNGHVDTVPTGPLQFWTDADPFSGKVIRGRIYGRGATDMKGGLAASIIALKALSNIGCELKGDVTVEAVSGEEMMNTEIGTGAAIRRGYRADAAIVMEPSGAPYRLAVVRATPGAMILTITVRGKAAHTLLRHELIRAGGLGEAVAVSAVEKAMIIYEGLRKLEEEWGQTKTHAAFPRPGCFTICPTTFAGGMSGASFIPEECVLKYVVWHAPQENQEQVVKEISDQIERFSQTDPWLKKNPPDLDWNSFWWPPYDLPASSPICHTAAKVYQDLFNIEVQPIGFMGVDDASFLNAAGIPAITWGPGDTRHAHTANESIEIDDLVDAAKLYALTMIDWCGS